MNKTASRVKVVIHLKEVVVVVVVVVEVVVEVEEEEEKVGATPEKKRKKKVSEQGHKTITYKERARLASDYYGRMLQAII